MFAQDPRPSALVTKTRPHSLLLFFETATVPTDGVWLEPCRVPGLLKTEREVRVILIHEPGWIKESTRGVNSGTTIQTDGTGHTEHLLCGKTLL
jgi:hypothetical protein